MNQEEFDAMNKATNAAHKRKMQRRNIISTYIENIRFILDNIEGYAEYDNDSAMEQVDKLIAEANQLGNQLHGEQISAETE